MAVIDPDDLIGRTYITSPSDDGSQHRIKIVEKLDVLADEMDSMPEMQRFRATNDEGTIEEIITYNQILQRLEKDDGDLGEWKFKSITSHDGPLTPSSPKYNGSKWNVHVEWENGEITWEPLGIIANKYIIRMLDNYVRMFGALPKEVITPLIKGDHPELDATSELDIDGLKKYQSLIGALQWVVTLGRLDIAVAVMTVSSFRAAPCEGHLERAKRIYVT